MNPERLLFWLRLELETVEKCMMRVDSVAEGENPEIDWALPQIIYYDAVRKYLQGRINFIRKTGRVP